MSRATSKSRGDKGRATSAQPPPPSQTPDTTDVISGRLTESEWLSMTSQQEGEDIVADLVGELVNSVLEKCYDVYLKKQLVPFSVAWAKDAMVHVINWQYLVRDEGDDVNTSSDLQEDREPQASIIDSWAEGCVPVIRIPDPSQEVDGRGLTSKILHKAAGASALCTENDAAEHHFSGTHHFEGCLHRLMCS